MQATMKGSVTGTATTSRGGLDTPSQWYLAIDFGTSFTAAAVRVGQRVDVLEIDGDRRFPSVVCVAEDGSLVVGRAAENRAGLAPERAERTPKKYLDVGQPAIVLAGQLMKTTDIVGRVLAAVWKEALRQHDGKPAGVRVTYPASWGNERQELLRVAARAAGMPDPTLQSEPEAAASYLAGEQGVGEAVADGGYVAVYDLGGGTFDTAVLRRAGERFDLVGEPSGDKRTGGELFDERIYRRLGESGLERSEWENLQTRPERDWRRANWEFRRQVREAKEAVSEAAGHPIFVPAPVGRDLQVTRPEVEELIRPDIETTLDILADTIAAAGISPQQLDALYLVGGSSRIPLVARLVEERFGRADTKGDPKNVVSLGAAQTGMERKTWQPPPPRPSPSPQPPQKRPGWQVPASVAAAAVVLLLVIGLAAAGGSKQSSDSSPLPVTPTPTTEPTPTDPTTTTEPTPTDPTTTTEPTTNTKSTTTETLSLSDSAALEFADQAASDYAFATDGTHEVNDCSPVSESEMECTASINYDYVSQQSCTLPLKVWATEGKRQDGEQKDLEADDGTFGDYEWGDASECETANDSSKN